MKLHAIISSVAVAAALSFSGPAMAQAVIGGTTIPADQMQRFQDACEALQAKETASLTSDETSGESTEPDATTTGSVGNEDNGQNGSPDPAAQENWDQMIAGLTVEDCRAGGFLVTP